MWKTLVLVGIIIIFPLGLSAQLEIDKSDNITQLETRLKEANAKQDHLEGWRIQIVSTTERRMYDRMKAKINMHYGHLEIHESFKKPYYRITTGAYLQKIDLLRDLHEIKRYFPSAFMIKDYKISKEEFIQGSKR